MKKSKNIEKIVNLFWTIFFKKKCEKIKKILMKQQPFRWKGKTNFKKSKIIKKIVKLLKYFIVKKI